jgi:hypothetical protein
LCFNKEWGVLVIKQVLALRVLAGNFLLYELWLMVFEVGFEEA